MVVGTHMVTCVSGPLSVLWSIRCLWSQVISCIYSFFDPIKEKKNIFPHGSYESRGIVSLLEQIRK